MKLSYKPDLKFLIESVSFWVVVVLNKSFLAKLQMVLLMISKKLMNLPITML